MHLSTLLPFEQSNSHTVPHIRNRKFSLTVPFSPLKCAPLSFAAHSNCRAIDAWSSFLPTPFPPPPPHSPISVVDVFSVCLCACARAG